MEPLISRRRFLGCAAWGLGGAGVATLGLGAYARWVEPYWVEYHDVDVAIPGLFAAFDGFVVAHVSDLHCGRKLPAEEVRAVFERVRARGPDLVVVTGDLVQSGDGAYASVLAELARIAADFPTYVVPANHEYWEGIAEFRRGVPAAGAVDLTNSHRVVERAGERLVFAGVDDLWEGGPDLNAALDGVDRDAQPVVLLMHNPDGFLDVRGRGVDLVLAGHTHGGQVKLPFLPAPVVPVRHRKYTRGFFREHGTALYVSRGVGMLLQVRFNCRPEVAFIVLRGA